MYGDYGMYDYGVSSTASGLGAISLIVILLSWGIAIFSIVCQWKIFKKAGKKGWEAIVPIYNIIVLFEISGTPLWMIILFFIPFANFYALFMIYNNLAKKFGKSTGFAIGLMFLPSS